MMRIDSRPTGRAKRTLRAGVLAACAAVVLSTLQAAGTAAASPAIGTGNDGNFTGVSCVSSTFCLAVGEHSLGPPSAKAPPTLVERFDGSAWTAMPTTGLSNVVLTTVDCVSPTFCMGVGSVRAGARSVGATAVFNGKSWSSLAPYGPKLVLLEHVTCLKPTFCMLVGGRASKHGIVPLIERYNGHRWLAQTPAKLPPAKKPLLILAGISCTSETSCVAVGGNFEGSGGRGLIETLTAHGWTQTANPSAANHTLLVDVTCPTGSACVVVGATVAKLPQNFVPVIETRTLGSWASVNTKGLGKGVLSSVACTSLSACVAVGVSIHSPIETALVATASGGGWRHTTTRTPIDSSLTAVSCAPSGLCAAVGQYPAASLRDATLAMTSHGHGWAIG